MVEQCDRRYVPPRRRDHKRYVFSCSAHHTAFLSDNVLHAAFEPVRAQLCRTLVRRFWGKEGYELHSDCVPYLRALHALPSPAGTPGPFPAPGIASNTDPAVSKILRSLGTLAGQTDPPDAGIREDEVWTTWAIEEDKKNVRFWREVLRRMRQTSGEADLQAEEVLVVGDELVSYVAYFQGLPTSCATMADLGTNG